jgi:hypothetical protein
MELDLYVCKADPRLFLLVPAGSEVTSAVPHHSRIFLGELSRRGSAWTVQEAADYLGAEPDKLADKLRGEGHYIHRVSKHQQPPTNNS